MNPGEHRVMSEVEDDHWWYRALRDVMNASLARPDFSLPDSPRILDAGCGTGANLRALHERFRPSYLAGFDLSEEGLAFAREKAPDAEIYASNICNPSLPQQDFDAIVSLDVIYIPGVQKAMGGLHQLVDALRPGGLFLVNLPAYDWLYSEHDVAIHTSERYTVSRVRKLYTSLGLEPVLMTYRLCALFPAVVATRLPGMWTARRHPERAKSDLHEMPSPRVNRWLYSIVSRENRALSRGATRPWGSSVFAVGRKPGARL